MIQRLKAFIDVLKESKNPAKVILAQMLAKSGLHKYFTIQMNGYKLKFSRSALAITLFANNKDRHEDEEFLRRILKPGDTYIDVGANIGTLVLAAAGTVMDNGKVIGIEAHPETFKNLQANVELNRFSNITLLHSAAGSSKGSLFFSNINSDDQNKVLLQKNNGIEVMVNTLDELLAEETSITLLKIDVEGYEKFVLEGAFKTLQKTDCILYESWDKHFSGFSYSTSDVVKLLNEQGFKVYKLNDNMLQSLSENYKSVYCENLIALKDPHTFCLRNDFFVQTAN